MYWMHVFYNFNLTYKQILKIELSYICIDTILAALTLTMSHGSQSSVVTVTPQSTSTDCVTVETRKRGAGGRSRQPMESL